MSARPSLKDHSIERLRERFGQEGIPPYRAEQIAGWLYRRGVDDIGAMTDLSRELREALARDWETAALEVESLHHSVDGTVKAILAGQFMILNSKLNRGVSLEDLISILKSGDKFACCK